MVTTALKITGGSGFLEKWSGIKTEINRFVNKKQLHAVVILFNNIDFYNNWKSLKNIYIIIWRESTETCWEYENFPRIYYIGEALWALSTFRLIRRRFWLFMVQNRWPLWTLLCFSSGWNLMNRSTSENLIGPQLSSWWSSQEEQFKQQVHYQRCCRVISEQWDPVTMTNKHELSTWTGCSYTVAHTVCLCLT